MIREIRDSDSEEIELKIRVTPTDLMNLQMHFAKFCENCRDSEYIQSIKNIWLEVDRFAANDDEHREQLKKWLNSGNETLIEMAKEQSLPPWERGGRGKG